MMKTQRGETCFQKFLKVLGGIAAFLIAAFLCQLWNDAGTSGEPTATSIPEPTPTTAYRTGTIVELIDAGLISVEPRGAGIDVLEIIIEKLVEEFLSVDIPLGTFFISNTESTQNMVVIRQKTVLITVEAEIEVSLDVACANIHRGVPNQDDTFVIEATPEQADLLLLLNTFQVDEDTPYQWEYHTYDVQQAAIWIVTDDATYADLGILVRSSSIGGFQVRAITEEEAGRAMRLVDQAGVDITQRAIWHDRALIIAGIEDDPELVTWLQERETQ
jgi:hypothetical protein